MSKPGYVCAPINLGSNTDPYQPIEREHQLTRRLLEVLLRYRHPVTIVTKGSLILRDLDLISELASQRLVRVMISLTTLDDELKRTLEPRAAAPKARLRAIRVLREAGVPVGVLCSPMIPMINDSELEHLLEAAQEAGAQSAAYMMLRLPLEVAPLFEQWLQDHYPQRAAHVLSLIRQSRGASCMTAASAFGCAAREYSPSCWPSAFARRPGGWGSKGGRRWRWTAAHSARRAGRWRCFDQDAVTWRLASLQVPGVSASWRRGPAARLAPAPRRSW